LQERPILSSTDLKNWLKELSELEAVIEEDGAWRYIRMTIDTTDEEMLHATKHSLLRFNLILPPLVML